MSHRSNSHRFALILLTTIAEFAVLLHNVSPARGHPRQMLSAALLVAAAPASAVGYSTQYEMNADPSTPAGVIDCDANDYDGNGILNVGQSGSGATFANGVMEYNDHSSSGNYGYYFAHSPPAETSFTIDMRIKVVSGVFPRAGAARSLSFSGGPGGRDRGLRLNTDGVEIVSGAGALGAAALDLATGFVRLRITYNRVTDAYSCYNLDTATTLIAAVSGGGTGAAGEISGAGGWAIGSLSASGTTDSHFFMDYFRILVGTAFENADPIMQPLTPPLCQASVTPHGSEARTGYEFGATPPPDPVATSISNAGRGALHYTFSEVDALGAAFDYPWISLNPISGSVDPGSNASVIATLSTTSLAAGLYTGYIKLTDDCNCYGCYCSGSPECLTEFFSYPNGMLVGRGGWLTGSASNEIIVASNEVRVSGGSGSKDAVNALPCDADGTGIISVKMKARNISGSGSTMWSLWINDDYGNPFGRWQGTADTAFGRNAQQTEITSTKLLTSAFSNLEVRVNTASNRMEFLADNVSLGSVNCGSTAGTGVGSVRIERISNAEAAGHEIAFDNLVLSVLEAQIRRIDLNVVGCSIQVQEPRIRMAGQCNDTSVTTEEFTIKNNGAFPWTAFTAGQFGTSRPWLTTVTFTSGPVPVNGTATVTAFIDWSQVTASEGARIKFSSTCDGSNFVSDTPSVGGGIETLNVTDPSTSGRFKVLYNADKLPSDNDSAGTGYKFELLQTNEQGSLVGDPTDPAPTDNKYYQLNDAAGQSTLWRLVRNDSSHVGVNATTGATVIARLKTTAFTAGASIPQNVVIYHNTIAAGALWDGAGHVQEAFRGNTASVITDSVYHIVRVTSVNVGTGNLVRVYVDENPVPVLTLQGAADANAGFGSSPTVAGIGFGTQSNSASQTIFYDWVAGTNAGAFAPGEDCLGGPPPPPFCGYPRVNVDYSYGGDNDVDMDDYGVFQTCYTGSGTFPLPGLCSCFDHDSDGDIDVADFNHFVSCATGPGIMWVPSVNCPD